MPALAAVLVVLPVTAAPLTWTGAGGDANWSTGANWGGVAPVNGDDLFFGTPVQINNYDDIAGLGIGGLTFNPGAPNFALGIKDQLLTISVLGIVNNSANLQGFGVGGSLTPGAVGSLQLVNNAAITSGAGVTIVNSQAAVAGGLSGYTVFANNASAGGASLANMGGNAFADGGLTTFLDAATAGSATFDNDPANVAMAAGGSVHFYDTATANSATINNYGGAVLGAGTGQAVFHGSATAGSAIINNGSATVAGAGSAQTEFNDTSTAGGAIINNNGGTLNGGSGGYARFWDTATAGTANLFNNGATVSGAGGGYTLFMGSSGAGSANLHNNGGVVDGAAAGLTEFRNTSSAGGATINNNPGVTGDADGGASDFRDNATAGSVIINNHGDAVVGVLIGPGEGRASFFDNASAGQAVINNLPGGADYGLGGQSEFRNNSTAANATINNDGLAFLNANPSSTRFYDTATAGNATINNNGNSVVSLFNGGFTFFFDSSTAGSATINNNSAPIANTPGGYTFFGGPSAGNATINNHGGAVAGAWGGVTWFNSVSTAGNAIINNHGATAPGAFGGSVTFYDTSTAANSTLIAGGGSGGGSGGTIVFRGNSSGGNARVIADGNGRLDISLLTAAGIGVGSIEGSGQFFLGSKNLSVGGLNTDTTVSGILQDGGGGGGVGGSLTKVGNGTLTLSGPNTYTGGTFINAGTVNVLHSQGLGLGNVTFNAGLLKSDPLVINIPGNYVQGAAATWQAAIAGTGAGQFDQLNIGGAATLGGTLRTVPFAGYMAHVGDNVTLVQTAGGLGGTTFATFDNQISAAGAAVAQLNYTANNVVLQWVQGSFLPYAMTYNQRSVAFNLDTAVADPREAALFNFLHNVPNSQLSATYDLIAPEELTSIFQLGFSGAEVQGYNLYNRIRDIRAGSSGFSASGLSLFDPVGAMDGMPRFASNQPVEQQAAMSKGAMEASPENKWGVFVSGAGELAGVRADANASGYHLTSGGLTVGADYRCNENFAVGVALGYNNTEADLTGDGEVDVNGGRGDLYGVWFKDGWHVEGMAGGGFNTYDTKREGLLGDAKGDTQGAEATGLLGFGYDWQSGPWTFGPQAKAQYTWVDIDSFREDGSMAPLRINSQDANSLYSQVGAHLMYRIQCGKVVLVPEIEVGWRHEYMDSTISLDSRFNSGAGTVFDVRGPELGRDSLVAGAGVTIRWNDRVSTSLNYNTQLLRSHYNLHSFSAGIRISL